MTKEAGEVMGLVGAGGTVVWLQPFKCPQLHPSGQGHRVAGTRENGGFSGTGGDALSCSLSSGLSSETH